jgi:L-ascorbate metabolism protein UlaG (beta-lactamase superfamily)
METANSSNTNENLVQVTPISHATMVLNLGGQVIYTDPVGGVEALAGQAAPTIILVTDIHGDHVNPETLSAVSKEVTVIVVPQAVKDMLPETIPGTVVVLANGEKTTQRGIEIEAIPMYNIPESASVFHTKGRGNGYVVSAEGKRVYIAGDTSATPEMKALQNIDVAFVPMNLPYTMDVDEAAEGVLAFKPKVVHPYHYRGLDGLADVNKFKELVNKGDPNIKVELLNFYPDGN